ncbi:MAG TPA: acetyl ornithine aminotransferase family protein [Gemmatimonadaceae bacterium]|nr:acetyl ornithine aminotransferase family protein [Gemmatimonadaceae bacterium]
MTLHTAPRSAAPPRDYPRIVVPPPGPRAREIIARHDRHASTSYPKEYGLAIARGAGAMVEDVDGNRYLDFMAGIAVAGTGHAHPAVVAAIREAAGRFLHICGSDFYFDGFSALCERLAALAPGSDDKRVFLSNSGTEAVEGAIKLTRNATRRPALVAFTGAFHGRTYGAMSLTASKARQRAGFGPFVPEVYHAPYPYPYRCELCDGTRCAEHCLAALDDLFARRLDPRDVAAVFVEPIQGEGGYVVPPRGFLQGLRERCDRHGILLVCDEVQSGVGRTGRMWACEHEGVEPDVLVTAKGLGSGMPIGAIVARASVMKWEPGAHGSTYGGNPVCCAAALATLDVVEREGLLDRAAALGERVMAGLRRLAERHEAIGEVRGRGLMIGLELVRDRETRAPDPELVHDVVWRAFERGLLLLGAGKSAIRLAPPLIIDERDVDTALAVLDECLALARRPAARPAGARGDGTRPS